MGVTHPNVFLRPEGPQTHCVHCQAGSLFNAQVTCQNHVFSLLQLDWPKPMPAIGRIANFSSLRKNRPKEHQIYDSYWGEYSLELVLSLPVQSVQLPFPVPEEKAFSSLATSNFDIVFVHPVILAQFRKTEVRNHHKSEMVTSFLSVRMLLATTADEPKTSVVWRKFASLHICRTFLSIRTNCLLSARQT